MAAVVLRIGTFIMLLALLCTGCMGAGEQGESTQNEMVSFSATVEYLDNALEELGGQDLLNGPVFADGYSCCRLGDTVLYWANHWYGPHQNGSVILAENPVGDWHFRITSGIFNLNKYNPNQVRQPCSTTGKS